MCSTSSKSAKSAAATCARSERLLLLAAALLAATASAEPEVPVGGFSAINTTHQHRMAAAMRARVARVESQPERKPDDAFAPTLQSCFAVPLGPRRVVALSLLAPAAEVRIIGPGGALRARAVLRDDVRRVAIFEAEAPLSTIGLLVPPPLPASARKRGMDVFSLTDTGPGAATIAASLLDVPELEEYEGHPRISVKLHAGMPVFDNRLRWLGYSRVVAWDVDRFMIIPPEKVDAAIAAASAPPPRPKKPARPWWAK